MPKIKSLNILIVDDLIINLKLMAGMLAHTPHNIDFAESGPEALEVLQQRPYDLVILDCLMPGMDGFQVARKIRAGSGSNRNSEVPILTVTTLDGEQDLKRGMEAGMTAYMLKPFGHRKLCAMIEKCTGTRSHSSSGGPLQSGVPIDAADTGQPDMSNLFGELSERLIIDVKEWQSQLLDLKSSANVAGLAALAHKIRGAADLLALHDLSKSATTLEQSVRANNTRDLTIQVDDLMEDLQKVFELISKSC